MSWVILIRTTANHYEFWSAEKNAQEIPTGRIMYGRIGTNGREHIYGGEATISGKIREKMNSGYVRLTTTSQNASPTRTQIDSFFGENDDERHERIDNEEPTPAPTPTPSPVQRVSERMNASRTRIANAYETTKTGNIKGYSYDRPVLQSTDDFTLTHTFARDLASNRARLTHFMEYFKGIPLEFRNGIREYGSSDESGTIRDMSGETFVVFYKGTTLVGTFSINSRQGSSNVFYVKSQQRNKKEIVRQMLLFMSTMVSSSTISIMKTPSVVEDEFKAITGSKTIRNVSPSTLNRTLSTNNSQNNFKRVVNKW